MNTPTQASILVTLPVEIVAAVVVSVAVPTARANVYTLPDGSAIVRLSSGSFAEYIGGLEG